MAKSLDVFTDSARQLARNPLGIIALFIVLVYGIAALVFGLSGASLEAAQKWPLIWFLVIFPVLVLFLFGWLVARHHTKLYSPTDFPDKEGFFRAMTPQEQRIRIENEVKAIEEGATGSEPTSQKDEIPKRIANDIRSKYLVAEELAFRQLEIDYKQPVHRNVGIAGASIGLDGLLLNSGQTIAIEIKYTRQTHWSQTVRYALKHIAQAASHLAKDVTFLLVIITEGISRKDRDKEVERVEQQLSKESIKVDLKVYALEDLQRRFGLSEES